jgi:ABC-type antimicrobial peptide transport system permease subunit
MPITQQLLLSVPSFVLGFFFVGGAVLFAVIGVLVVRRFITHSQLRTHHDVADPMLGAVAAVYSVLVAFVAVNVWQNFDNAKSNVELESNYLADIYRDSEALSPDFHQKVSVLLREYRQAVVDYEWQAMEKGQMSPKVEELMNKIWALYTKYEPKNLTQEAFFNESVRKLNSFRELRRQRLMDSRRGIVSLLWVVLVIGGISTLSFSFFFGAENLKAQLAMASILAIIISLILFVIMLLDFPFTGDIAVTSEPFRMALLN